jgi:hypothetical protein
VRSRAASRLIEQMALLQVGAWCGVHCDLLDWQGLPVTRAMPIAYRQTMLSLPCSSESDWSTDEEGGGGGGGRRWQPGVGFTPRRRRSAIGAPLAIHSADTWSPWGDHQQQFDAQLWMPCMCPYLCLQNGITAAGGEPAASRVPVLQVAAVVAMHYPPLSALSVSHSLACRRLLPAFPILYCFDVLQGDCLV